MLLLIVPHTCQYADKRGQVQVQARATDEAIEREEGENKPRCDNVNSNYHIEKSDYARSCLTAHMASLRISEATKTSEASALNSWAASSGTVTPTCQ